MTTLKLQGLDCPVCAQSLEDGLKALPGVRAASVDFATLTLKIDGPDVATVKEAITRLEPGVLALEGGREPAPPQGHGTGKTASATGFRASFSPEVRKEVLLVAGAAVLSGLGFALDTALPPFGKPALLVAAWLLAGHDVLLGAVRNIRKGRVFDELFLMGIATLGAIVLGQYAEAVGVMVFYKIGEAFQDSAAARSRASVRALLDLRPDLARLRRGESWTQVPAAEVAVGDTVLVLPGERIPVDGRVASGESLVDSQVLTGEPRPRRAFRGEEVLAAALNLDGALEIVATRPAGESSAAKIATLVEEASHAKAKTERFVSRFARVYTPIVVGLAAALALLPPLIGGGSLALWTYRALVLLVISCPCALVISIPLGYFGGIGGAARQGILVKGGTVLDALARVGSVVFDKTGTLTEGVFRVQAILPAPGHGEVEVLGTAALAESRSRHPIAASIREAALVRGLSDGTDDEVSESRERAGRGLSAWCGGQEILVGNRSLLEEGGIAPALPDHEAPAGQGLTEIHVARGGEYLGCLLIGDEVKPDAAPALAYLTRLGVDRMAILTGDSPAAAAPLAVRLGIAEVHGGLLPEDKLSRLEGIIAETTAQGRTTLFVGDGVNDAPVLARADVGLAMGGGADAAVECADVILMTNEPSKVAEAIARARRTQAIVRENIVGSLAIKGAFLALGALGLAVMWEAVIADVGVALLATLNASRALSAGKAHTGARHRWSRHR